MPLSGNHNSVFGRNPQSQSQKLQDTSLSESFKKYLQPVKQVLPADGTLATKFQRMVSEGKNQPSTVQQVQDTTQDTLQEIFSRIQKKKNIQPIFSSEAKPKNQINWPTVHSKTELKPITVTSNPTISLEDQTIPTRNPVAQEPVVNSHETLSEEFHPFSLPTDGIVHEKFMSDIEKQRDEVFTFAMNSFNKLESTGKTDSHAKRLQAVVGLAIACSYRLENKEVCGLMSLSIIPSTSVKKSMESLSKLLRSVHIGNNEKGILDGNQAAIGPYRITREEIECIEKTSVILHGVKGGKVTIAPEKILQFPHTHFFLLILGKILDWEQRDAEMNFGFRVFLPKLEHMNSEKRMEFFYLLRTLKLTESNKLLEFMTQN